jgi:hypothetical protein
MRRRAPPLARTRSRHKAQHGARVGQVRILRACPHGNQEPSARRPPNLPADGFCSKCPAHAEKLKTAALKGDARLIDPCNASAHQGPAHGDGLRRPTGESSHRSSRHHGAASMPLDPPPGTDPTTQLAAQQPRFTPKRRGVPKSSPLLCHSSVDRGFAEAAQISQRRAVALPIMVGRLVAWSRPRFRFARRS